MRPRPPGASHRHLMMIEIRHNDTETRCAVCGRTVLLGERLVNFRRVGLEDALVCELCTDQADARGWTREGSPALPVQLGERRERGLRGMLKQRRRGVTAGRPGRRCRGGSGAVQREHASSHRLRHRPHARRPARQRHPAQPSRGRRHRGLGSLLVPVPGGHAGRADRHAPASGRGTGRTGRPFL